MGLIIPFPLSPTPNKEALPLLIDEHGWDGEAAFRVLCAVPRLPREKSVSSYGRQQEGTVYQPFHWGMGEQLL